MNISQMDYWFIIVLTPSDMQQGFTGAQYARFKKKNKKGAGKPENKNKTKQHGK